MLKIGDFSRLSRISIRMLRHYDEIGLLMPENVDKFTNYRYYSEEQLILANRISSLKDMGFSLSTIVEILKNYSDPGELKKYLLIKHKEMQELAEDTNRRLLLLDRVLNEIGEELTMEYNVTLKEMPERYVASLRMIIPAYNKEGMLWEMMYKEASSYNLQCANPPYSLAIFYDEGYKEADVDVEIQISVQGKHEDTEHVVFKTVPPITIASAIYKGSYEKLTGVNLEVARWIKDNQYEFAGPMFTIYHVGPATEKNPDNWVTEVCFPVKKK